MSNFEDAAETVKAIKDAFVKQIARATESLSARIEKLEAIKPVTAEDVLTLIPATKDGKDGTDGADGKSVDAEEIRKMIAEAVQAAVVIPENGKDGTDGADGKDALQLEILPEIDEQKSYSRGTFARHDGGLFRAYEKTHGLRGWECIVEGIASLEVVQHGEKGFKTVARMSSGSTVEKEITLPVAIYKGVYRDGENYTAGDMTTWGGSVWHCESNTTDKPMDGSKSWKLAVKRGQDGKNGRDGRDLVKGVSMT